MYLTPFPMFFDSDSGGGAAASGGSGDSGAPTKGAPTKTGAESIIASLKAQGMSLSDGGDGSAEARSTPAPAPPPEDSQDGSSDDGEGMGDVEVETGGKKESLSWNDAMKRVPKDVARLMKKMQADYTRKTQEAASTRKEVQREREALMRAKKALEEQQAELPEYDPFNEQSIQARIEREVKARLAEALAPVEQEYQILQAEEQYQTFVRENPDFQKDEGLRKEIQTALEANPNLDLETAYWAVKGRRTAQQRRDDEARKKAQAKARREAALTGTGSSRKGRRTAKPSKSDIKNMSAADILRYAQEQVRG